MKISALRHFSYNIILGSASPRRKQLLHDLGFSFSVEPVHTDESSWPQHLQREEIALHLAEKKSDGFRRKLGPADLLLTADTIVWQGGEVFNKPADEEEGRMMLRSLSGSRHEVFTGVCLRSAERKKLFCGATSVYFKQLDDDEITYYLQTCRPFDKAGSYGVQDWLGYTAIERIDGSFYNVMGLPVHQLYEELLSF